MDSKALLQDLHFELSSSGSAHVTGLKKDICKKKDYNLLLDVEDRTEMTAKWVANLWNRQRSLSSDSYFGAESVCDKLKKSFLKPCTVTEDDMEDLRVKLAQMELQDSKCMGDSEFTLAHVEINDKNERPLQLRFRSKTVPLYNPIFSCASSSEFEDSQQENAEQQHVKADYNFSLLQASDERDALTSLGDNKQLADQGKIDDLASSYLPQAHSPDINLSPNKDAVYQLGEKCDIAVSNLASLQSVDLIKDILIDENCNQIVPAANNPESIRSPEKVLDKSPIQSFRSENLFPSPTELKGSKVPIKLNPNRIVGCYENEEDYLKTQFYLLKSDFIEPLREGIENYKWHLRRGKIPVDVKNLKLHHNVRVMEPIIREDKLGLAIDMGFPLSEKIGEKDFMDGSLVLITTNHFKDIYVGTVLSRRFVLPVPEGATPSSNRRRRSNILVVQLHGTSHFDPALKHRKVLLAESQAFFQPYYYVMKIFQGMNDDDLPLKEYIVGSQSSLAITSPSYLLKDTEYLLEDNINVTVLNNATWPRAKDLNVNDSQLRALKKALSEKLVLIQGPPGTGKTYLGCKVARALLQNMHVWNKEGNRPMLLMCQTNHALDQFMELLLPMSKSLIRIGCQSKSDLLAPYNIRHWMKMSRHKAHKQSNLLNLYREMKTLASSIEVHKSELGRLASHGILDLQTFVSMGIMDLKHAGCFISSEHFLQWLEEARICKATHSSGEELANEQFLKSTDCVKHGNLSTGEESQEENLSARVESQEVHVLNGLDILPSSSLVDGTSSMRDVVIKYIISFPDYESEFKGKKHGNKIQRKEREERLTFFKCSISEKNKNESKNVATYCPWAITPHIRWDLYRYWVKELEKVLQSNLQLLELQYLSVSSSYADLKQFEKLAVMRQAEIVGMTTSAAARLYPVLRKLQCPIALVEEAAEVHESHIVATVTKHCQHLILLGDHKQLRPRPASYALSKTHFTDVSLFERLVLNKAVVINTLLIQHRMQPQISALIRPSIYAELHDHDCTRNRKNIVNIKKNVFFFSHHWEECKNLVTGSYSNPEEAKMAVQLLRYLLMEQYRVDEICILSAYREQVNVLEANCMLYPELSGVRLLTVDNFQGEECRIVILSLVRNNPINQIGFLKIENRVCVALSRARDGLFILGNIDLLSRNSELWMSVHKVLKAKAMVGQSIPLSCSRHPHKTKNVSQPDDLSQYINSGGCRQACLYKLPCGHFCRRICHTNDASHTKYRCEESCQHTCAFGHKCGKLCFEMCGDCECIGWKHLVCGHWALMRCSLEPSTYLCEAAVQKCMEPCSHLVNVQCWMPPVSHKYCPNQCPSFLKCGHRCPVRCNAVKHPNHLKVKCCQTEGKHELNS